VEGTQVLRIKHCNPKRSKICNNDDMQKLQEDLNTLQEWTQTWQMQFDVKKCKVVCWR